ncbi:MAG: hypothetical protein AAGF89_06155, partial [Bacteroidota bacterium]
MDFGFTDLFVLFSALLGLVVGAVILLVPYLRSTANRYLGWFTIMLGLILMMAWQSFDLVWL